MEHEFGVVVIGQVIVVVGQSVLDLCSFLFVEEGSRLGVIRQSPEGDNGDSDGKKSLEDEDPGPTWPSTNTVHLVNASCQESSECAGYGGGGEEDSGSECAFSAAIPQGNFADMVSFYVPLVADMDSLSNSLGPLAGVDMDKLTVIVDTTNYC